MFLPRIQRRESLSKKKTMSAAEIRKVASKLFADSKCQDDGKILKYIPEPTVRVNLKESHLSGLEVYERMLLEKPQLLGLVTMFGKTASKHYNSVKNDFNIPDEEKIGFVTMTCLIEFLVFINSVVAASSILQDEGIDINDAEVLKAIFEDEDADRVVFTENGCCPVGKKEYDELTRKTQRQQPRLKEMADEIKGLIKERKRRQGCQEESVCNPYPGAKPDEPMIMNLTPNIPRKDN